MLSTAVLFAIVVVVLTFSGVPIPPEGWKALETVIPAWLQGIGTIAAAIIAAHALGAWREQDRARQKVMWLERALIDSYTLERHLSRVLAFQIYNKPLTVDALTSIYEDKAPHIESSDLVCGKLRAQAPIIRTIISADLADSITALCTCHEIFEANIESLQKVIEILNTAEANNEQRFSAQREAESCLQVLGCITLDGFLNSSVDLISNEYRDTLDKQIKHIDLTISTMLIGREING